MPGGRASCNDHYSCQPSCNPGSGYIQRAPEAAIFGATSATPGIQCNLLHTGELEHKNSYENELHTWHMYTM